MIVNGLHKTGYDVGVTVSVGFIVSTVTSHFVPRSFRTQVISYHFGHFVPTFIFNLVISYPVWSFRTHFSPSVVISYLLLLFCKKLFGSFRTYFLLFRTQVISYPKSFRTHFSHFVPRSFRTHFQTRYELTWVRNDVVVAVICYFQTRYELTLVGNDFLFMPRHQKVAGYYVIPSEILSVRPSVRLSVYLSCPSVRPSAPTTILVSATPPTVLGQSF